MERRGPGAMRADAGLIEKGERKAEKAKTWSGRAALTATVPGLGAEEWHRRGDSRRETNGKAGRETSAEAQTLAAEARPLRRNAWASASDGPLELLVWAIGGSRRGGANARRTARNTLRTEAVRNETVRIEMTDGEQPCCCGRCHQWSLSE